MPNGQEFARSKPGVYPEQTRSLPGANSEAETGQAKKNVNLRGYGIFSSIFLLQTGKKRIFAAYMSVSLVTSMPMYVCAFWSVLFLLDVVEKRQTSKKRLLAYMVAATLLYAGHYVFFGRMTAIQPMADTVYCTVNLAVFPLYYIYLKELTEPEWNHRWQWLLLVPAALAGITVGLLYVLMSPEETIQFIDEYLYHNRFSTLSGLGWWQAAVHGTVKTVFALMIPPILTMGFIKIRRYEQAVEQNYANTDDKRLPLVKAVLVLFVATSLLSFGANLMGRHHFTSSLWLLLMPSLLFSGLQFLLGYAGYRQQFTIRDLLSDLGITAPSTPQVANEGNDDEAAQRANLDELAQQIIGIVNHNRLYLQPNLKITDVAALLHTNRTYVSRVLKEDMGTTFADFINRQRIDYACQLMEQQPEMGAAEVARQSGFSSQSSFYRNYKLFKGHPPKENQATP